MNCRTVKVAQFYGIDINELAIKVLKICFLLAELQISGEILDISALDKNIIASNALRMDWNELLANKRCSYIISNPPFCAPKRRSKDQRTDVLNIFKNTKNGALIDYVGCWHKKASEYMKNTLIKTALVSTNSICQGEQVAILWKDLFKSGIHINFAYKTFKWNSESPVKAHVHCIIVGFSYINESDKIIFNGSEILKAKNINAYLKDAPNIIVERRKTPICANVPKMTTGCRAVDGGNFVLTPEEKALAIKNEPLVKKYLRPYIGAKELLRGIKRYCLWLKNVSLKEISKSKLLSKRVSAVKRFRENSKAIKKNKKSPTLFFQTPQQPNINYLVIPCLGSNNNLYIPTFFLDDDTIVSESVRLIQNPSKYHFGVISSSTHARWLRAVCGCLGESFRYSEGIVYNTFPWPNPTEKQKENIEKTANMILDARKLYPNWTLSQLYNSLTMPPELKNALKSNDEAVFDAYGFNKNIKEEECVTKLMEMYESWRKKKAYKGEPFVD